MNWLAFLFDNIERHIPRGGPLGWIVAIAVPVVAILIIVALAV